MKKSNTGLLIAILSVGVLILVALTLNLAMGGVWIMKGMDGKEGKSAYELAVENGFTGSLTEWLASLGGSGGKSAYEIAVDNGFEGSEKEWLISLAFGEDGKDGKDGRDGRDGENGKNGRDGEDGKDGKDGNDGISIVNVKISENGHLTVSLSDGTVIDAGYVGTYVIPTRENDYTKAQADGYTGTLTEWLRGLQTGERTGADGKKLSVSDCYINSAGHLIVALSDGTTVLDAGEIPQDGYLSEAVEEYGMRPRFEMMVMNWEVTGLNLRDKPDVTNGKIVTGLSQTWKGSGSGSVDVLCIGRGEVDGDVFLKFLLSDGRICYAKQKFFEAKHATVVGEEGLRLPDSLTLTAGKSMRLTLDEIAPWADGTCFLTYLTEELTVAENSDGTVSLSCASPGTYTMSFTLSRRLTADTVQLLASKTVTVKVAAAKTVAGKKGLLIGDSRINPAVAGMASLTDELAKLLPGVEWVGTQTTAGGMKCEGYSGWKAENFRVSASVKLGDVTKSNPFYNPDTKGFDFAYYLEQNPDCKPDFVVINLGANDCYSVSSANTALAAIVNSIHAYDPELPVLVLTEYTRRPGDAAYASDVLRRLSSAYFGRLTEAFAGGERAHTYLIPNFLSVDPTIDRADAAHLTSAGYAHEADVIVTYLADLLGT